MQKIEAVIFDWAGTTIDFGCMAPVASLIKAFNAYQIKVSLADTRKPMGLSKRDHIKTMLTMPAIQQQFQTIYQHNPQDNDIDQIYTIFEKNLFNDLENYITLKPYLLETIKWLRCHNIKIGSTTGYTYEMMKIVTQKAKELGYEPDFWIAAEGVGGYGRPYPYMIFANMQRLKLHSVKNIMKIGDTQADIDEALAAGVIAVGIIEGSSEMGLSEEEWHQLPTTEKEHLAQQVRQKYQTYGAHFVLDNLSQLPELIKYYKYCS